MASNKFVAVSLLAVAALLQRNLISEVHGDAACAPSYANPGQCEYVGGGCRQKDECCVYVGATGDCVCTALLNCATFGSTSTKLSGKAKRGHSFWYRREDQFD